MSKIDEIRKNHRECDDYEELNSLAHRDRGDLLALLDSGAWQDERPNAGDWYMSPPVAARDARWDPVEFVHVNEDGAVWSDSPGCDGEHIGYLGNPLFRGAKWKRRTVPSDPFTKEENHE